MHMAWFDESVFYHIYPLGLVGAPKKNKYTKPYIHGLDNGSMKLSKILLQLRKSQL